MPTTTATRQTRSRCSATTTGISPADQQGAGDTVPRCIPTRLGGPSPIKHVVVIVKENRTYDQVLGDLGEGNGDPRWRSSAPGYAEPARAGHALRRPRQLLRRGHAFGRRPQLAGPGRGQRLRREGVRRVLPVLPVTGRRRARLPARRVPVERGPEVRPQASRTSASTSTTRSTCRRSHPCGLSSTPSRSGWRTGDAGPEPISNPCQCVRAQCRHPVAAAITDPCFPNFQLSIPDQYRVDDWLPTFKQQRAARPDAQPDLHVADDRPHRPPVSTATPGPLPGRPGRRQRPRRRTRHRHDLPQQVLEEHGGLRRRGRHPERHRSRGRSPRPRSDQPVLDVRTWTTSTTRSSTWSRRSSRSSASAR